MPNQRDSKKKMLGVYLDEEEYELLKLISKRTGTTMTDLVKQFIDEYAERKLKDEDTNNQN